MVQWTAEKDAALLAGVLEFMNISATNSKLLEHLSKKIGEGCTPKAVSHRLNNIKNKNKGAGGGTGSPTATPKKAAATPKTPGTSGRGRGRPPKAKYVDGEGAPRDDSEEMASPTVSRKRGPPQKSKKDAQSQDEEPEAKKIKVEEEDFSGILGNGEDGVGVDEESDDI